MVAPDLTNVNLVILAKPARNIHHARRYIKIKCRSKLREMSPLREGLQMVDRLTGFDLDDRLDSFATLLGVEHQVGVERRRTTANRGVLLGSRVDIHVVPAPALGLQQTDDTIVLELLADWPDQDGAHRAPPRFDRLMALGPAEG
jgi:hypothetical protein